MLLEAGKELFGNTLYTVGDIYTIAYTCNHFDTYEVLYNPKYTTLTPGMEVMLLGKTSIREGVFARVKPLYSDVEYDIYYTNLGGTEQCVSKKKSKTEAKLEKDLARKSWIKQIKQKKMKPSSLGGLIDE